MRPPSRTVVSRLGAALRDDTGSLPFALLLVLISTSLSALLAPIVVTQVGSTRVEVQRVGALDAARAGLDVALGQIRRANDGSGTGHAGSLPCGTLTGSVGGDGGSTYLVTIAYTMVTDTGTAPVSCANLVDNTPLDHADLSSTGTAGASRTLTARYKFWNTTTNLLGGLIPAYPTSGVPDLCIDAGSAHPAATTAVRMQPCVEGSAQQTFAYNPDLTLMLVSSTTSSLGTMCLDSDLPHQVGNAVVLKACPASGTAPPPSEIWSLNNHANFEGTSDGKTTDNYCFNVQSPGVATSPLVLGYGGTPTKTCQQQHDDREAFSPEPSVGAGAAGPSTGQLVNYSQFGRCLDVTHANPNYGFLVIWPCKQAPDPTTISWNEKWAMVPSPLTPGRVLVTTTDTSGNRYCLQMGAPNAYVNPILCPPSNPGLITTSLEWYQEGSNGNIVTQNRIEWIDPANPNTKYCLSPNDATVDPYIDIPAHVTADMQISKLIAVTCDGSGLRKWNVNPGTSYALPLTGLNEQ